MEERKSLTQWVKEHEKELIIAGVSIAVISAVIIGIKNHKALEKVWESLRNLVEKTSDTVPVANTISFAEVTPVKDIEEIGIVANRIPHSVVEHLRNLPEGWRASEEKIATAAEHGYDLLPGQTWVETYRTGGRVA